MTELDLADVATILQKHGGHTANEAWELVQRIASAHHGLSEAEHDAAVEKFNAEFKRLNKNSLVGRRLGL